jgi:hypothetical protein
MILLSNMDDNIIIFCLYRTFFSCLELWMMSDGVHLNYAEIGYNV